MPLARLPSFGTPAPTSEPVPFETNIRGSRERILLAPEVVGAHRPPTYRPELLTG
jgi:hypothetical protein